MIARKNIIKIDEYTYEIPSTFRSDMRVPARFFSTEAMIEDMLQDSCLTQLINTTTLPGIQKYAFGMPDMHQGYGFPIGGVVATALDEGGVISPGGIGYDINCGVRLLAATIQQKDVRVYLSKLADALFKRVPSGVGRVGGTVFSSKELDLFLRDGAQGMVSLGYGTESDYIMCEEQGRMPFAKPELISDIAKKRGENQLGTLGSGNHFLELQYVDELFDKEAAQAFGLSEGQVTVMIHCGSRGLGHQTCTDYVRLFMQKADSWGFVLPDRELVSAPFYSQEGQDYFGAMAAASNYAWANRHVIGHLVRKAWHDVFADAVALRTVYDLSHNIGKIETHIIDGKQKACVMHRKGATRSFGPGDKTIPQQYKAVGQPVLIPGTMGTASYVLVGTAQSEEVAFGSSCHGAGRKMSRIKAKGVVNAKELKKELQERGILVRCDSSSGLAEEAPCAYKDVDDVVEATEGAGLARKVARLRPLAVIKGG